MLSCSERRAWPSGLSSSSPSAREHRARRYGPARSSGGPRVPSIASPCPRTASRWPAAPATAASSAGMSPGSAGVDRRAHGDDANGFTQVLSVAFSPDGKTLASGGWDRAVRLWDTANGALKRTLAHENLVYSVAFSPDGRTLASGEHQIGAIRLWEVETGKSAGVLVSGRGSVWSAAFAPDGTALASGGYIVRRGGGGVVRLWDVSSRAVSGRSRPSRRGRSPSRPMGGCWRARVTPRGPAAMGSTVSCGSGTRGPASCGIHGPSSGTAGPARGPSPSRPTGGWSPWEARSVRGPKSGKPARSTCGTSNPTGWSGANPVTTTMSPASRSRRTAGSWLPGGVTRSSSCGISPS